MLFRVKRSALVLAAAGMPALMTHVVAPQTAVFTLPAPTGPFQVGTTSWHVADANRRETFAEGAARQVQVLAWYPVVRGAKGQPAPYLRNGLPEVRTFAKLIQQPETLFDGTAAVATHAILDGLPSTDIGRLPVLLFSHGYTGIASAHTALLEDLASHGYAVLSIVHPYEVSAATLDDGRTVTMLGDAGALRQPIQDVFSEWGDEDAMMTKVTATAGVDERRALLRQYLERIPKTTAALRRWVDDTRSVLDALAPVETTSAAGRLKARLDPAGVGVLGHSMGGVSAGQFCVEDRRCRAALNLDGIPQYGAMIDTPLDRPFLMVYSARPGRLGASDAIYARAAAPYYRVDVRDTKHLDFSDMNFWGGPLQGRAFGPMPPARAADLTRMVVREFFDGALLNKRSPLLTGARAYPELTVTRPAR